MFKKFDYEAKTGKGSSGLEDMVLIGKITDDAIVDNIKKRFNDDLIYTYIGPILIAVNPFKSLPYFTDREVDMYCGCTPHEVPPHIYALTDKMYRDMLIEGENQCVIISGESGAGKTVSAKYIMNYVAAISPKSTGDLENIKRVILESNPLLEAFGNAKTIRNNNSSRFGKYFQIEFSRGGAPDGGKISNFLLEKSRVSYQQPGERNFHIFYQMTKGCSAKEREWLGLSGPENFFFLNQGGTYDADGQDDPKDYQDTRNAMGVCGIDPQNQQALLQIAAGVLHLGNIYFAEQGNNSVVYDPAALEFPAYLLGLNSAALNEKLISRMMTTGGVGGRSSVYNVPLNTDQAAYTRNALAKALYSRMFDWIVEAVNKVLVKNQTALSLGVLDIYGFEIFEKNGFEQFCINYCNEKLQQIFIELTLKSEQEEYMKEGIQWTPIDYFNNAIICQLIEEKHGMIGKLDEECIRPGDVTQFTLMDKFNESFGTHAHYQSRATNKNDKSLDNDVFRLKHYAGDVVYNVEFFIDKNKDLLFKDLMYCMNSSSSDVIKILFPEGPNSVDLKRPDSAGTQFKNSMDTLMKNLLSKNPHYVRCIKPNDSKQPNTFDPQLSLHQVRYLGLLENVRVKRAGFCYRQKYEKFLERYKMLSGPTWPTFSGAPKEGCSAIMGAQEIVNEEYQLGKSKIFIRNPLTLFQLEEDRNKSKHRLVTSIKANYLAHYYSVRFEEMRKAQTKISATFRGHSQFVKYRKDKAAAIRIAAMVRGFLARLRYRVLRKKLPKYAAPILQKPIKQFLIRSFLKRFAEAAKKAGDDWRHIQWPTVGPKREKTAAEIKRIYTRHMARNYRKNLKPERKLLLEEKGLALDLFKGKKANYEDTLTKNYKGDQLSLNGNPMWSKTAVEGEKIIVAFNAMKVNRSDLKKVERSLIISDKGVISLEKGKLKARVPLENVSGFSCSSRKDNVLIIHCENEKKGDLWHVLPDNVTLIETVVRSTRMFESVLKKKPTLKISDSIQSNTGKGHNTLKFEDDATVPEITFKKDGKENVICALPSGAPSS